MVGEADPSLVKPRVVFDCMVFLQGAGRPASPSRACFHLVDEGQIDICLSSDILAEVRDVLTRPRTRKRFPLLSAEWVETFVQNAEHKAVVVLTEVASAFSLERDPKDEPYLDLAVAAGARYLVSRDRDLLDLMDDPQFRQRFPDLIIVDPPAFLQAIRSPRPIEQSSEPWSATEAGGSAPGVDV